MPVALDAMCGDAARYLVPEKNIPAYKLGNLLIEPLEIRLFTLDKYTYLESARLHCIY